MVISRTPKTGKFTVLSNLPQFPQIISFMWKKFSYILKKGNNIRKLTQQTIFELSWTVETQKIDLFMFWCFIILSRDSSIFRIFDFFVYIIIKIGI